MMLFHHQAVFVVATIVLSLVQARPTPVLDTDADAEPVNSQRANVSSLQSASMKDACAEGNMTCIDQILSRCVNGRWKFDQTRRKRSRVDASCGGGPKARKGGANKYSDTKGKNSGGNYPGSKVPATPAGFTITTTTLTPEQAQEEISQLLGSAMSTVYYTSTGTSHAASQTTAPSSTAISDCTSSALPTSSSSDSTSTSATPSDCSLTTSSCRSSTSDCSSNSSTTSQATSATDDYPSSNSSATCTGSTTSPTAETESGSGAIGNIRLTMVPLTTATATSTSATTSATKSVNNGGGGEGGAGAIVSIRLTTVKITPTATG